MRLGHWLIDREQRTLSDSTRTRSLTPRSWDVFVYLLDHRGQLVTTATLLTRFWRNVSADETYVRKSILEIRKALGDDARSPLFIKTIPKQGYVFLPERASDPEVSAGPVLAVLPFMSIGSGRKGESMADGMTEEVLNKLTRGLTAPVLARTSTFQFKGARMDIREIGAALNATHILEGSIRTSEGSIRVTAQLIDCRTGAHLWSQTYQRELQKDVFELQEGIADEVTETVRLTVGGAGVESDESLRTVYVSQRFTEPDQFRQIVAAVSRREPKD
jgi:TolB-like protein